MKQIVAFLLMIILKSDADNITIKCPEFCECGVFEKLRRAECTDRNLVSLELNIPPQAEILDLSGNHISELGDKIFLEIGLKDLKLLNLSHNKVNQIHFNGFQGLENLKTLDLSYNALEYFSEAWFPSLNSLEELYLRGNKLRKINEEPKINIKTLKILDISSCGLTRLDAKTFEFIPNLRILDISENYIQIIQMDLLEMLPKLTTLKAHDNNLNCKDKRNINLAKYAENRRITFTDSCNDDFETAFTVNSHFQKFQKIQMADDVDVEYDIDIVKDIEKNSWIFEETIKNNETKIVEVCSNGGTNETSKDHDGVLMAVIKLSPWGTVSIVFVYGMFCGMVLSSFINLCSAKNKAKRESQIEIPDGSIQSNTRRDRRFPRSNSILYSTLQKAKRSLPRDNCNDYSDGLVMSELDLADSTPVAARKTFI